MDYFIICNDGVEVAIGAFAAAKRDVDVYTFSRIWHSNTFLLNNFYDILTQSRKIFNNVIKSALRVLIFCGIFAIIRVYIK